MTDNVTQTGPTVVPVRPVIYSASSVNAYLNCHLQWWFGYVATVEGVRSVELDIGVSIHDVAEKYLRGEPIPKMAPDVEGLAGVFMLEIAPTIGHAMLIEAPFQIVVDGIGYSGIIDYLDQWFVLRDLKSTKQRPKMGRYRFQRIGYWLGLKHDLDIEPVATGLDYIVRTRRPYFWPERYDPPTQADIDWFSATLEGVAAGIARADYKPTGLGTWACGSCPYADICGPYARYKEKIGG